MAQATLKNRVIERSTTTGTGAFTLAGVPDSRYQSFLAAMGAAAVTYYMVVHEEEDEWEAGVGIVNGDGTLTRSTVIKSTNADNLVDFSAGTKEVFNDIPAEKLVALDSDSNKLTLPGALSVAGASTLTGLATLTSGFAAGANSTLSAGNDADSDFAIGSGHAGPTASRTASLTLNAPDTGAFRGAAKWLLKRAASLVWSVGLFSSVAGAMTAIDDFAWAPNPGTTPVAALSTAGALKLSGGLTAASAALTAPLAVSSGGTGFASYAAGDTLYASGATTLAKVTIGAANSVYTSGGSAPQWSTSLNLAGSLTAGTGITVPTGGITVTGNSTINGTLGVAGTLTSTVAASGTAFQMVAGARFYLDGGGNTYLTESSADIVTVFAGGAATLDIGTLGPTVYSGLRLALLNSANNAGAELANYGGSGSTALNVTSSLVTFSAAATVTGRLTGIADFYIATATSFGSAYGATTARVYADAVYGATLSGFGTTSDTTLLNRAGSPVLEVTFNTQNLVARGALAITGALSGVTTFAANSGATNVTATMASTATTAYSAGTSGTVVNSRLQLSGGNATDSFTTIRFTHSGSFENFFGAVQTAAGVGDFIWGGYNGVSYGEWMRLTPAGALSVLGTINGQTISSAANFTGTLTVVGDVTVQTGATLHLTAGDLKYTSNAGFGILSADSTRAIAITNAGVTLNDATTLTGTLAVTGASTFSDTITRTGAAATGTAGMSFGGTTTGYHYVQMTNTGAGLVMGIEGSAGNQLFTGSAAYASGMKTGNATDLVFATNEVIRLTLASGGAATFSGALGVTGLLSTVAGYQFRGSNATAYELFRYAGGTNNPGVFVKSVEASSYVSLYGSSSAGDGDLWLGASAVEGVIKIHGTTVTITQATAFTANPSANTTTAATYEFYNSGYGVRVTSATGLMELITNSATGIALSNAQAVRFNAYGAGAITADASGNLTSVSDERHKTGITRFVRGLASLRGLKPISYRYNERSGLEREHTYLGFSAQNVRESLPEAVFTHPKNGMLSLWDRGILALHTNAILELDRQVLDHEDRIRTLERRLAA